MSAEGDALITRLRMALAEMGYGDVEITEFGTHRSGQPRVKVGRSALPAAIWWQACNITSKYRTACWSCWRLGHSDECVADTCRNPNGPAHPPRELLVRA